jgi:predicted MFS family arabinose efflux permease
MGEPAPPPLHRNRDFVLLWTGQAVSVLGSRVSGIAYPLLVLALTGSPAEAGLVGFAGTLPYLLVQLPAGVWLDRWNRKRAMIAADAVRGVALASIPVAWWAGVLTVPQIALVAFVEGCMFAIFSAAEPAALAHVVPAEQLPPALAQNEARTRAAGLVGPPLGGLLFALGQAVPFAFDAASYLASVVTLRAVRASFQEAAAPVERRSLWAEMREGLGWLWRQPLLRDSALLVAGSNLLFQAYVLVVIVLAQDRGASSAEVGLILAGAGLGGVAGAVIAPAVQRRVSARWVVIGCNWVWAALMPLFAVAPNALALGLIWVAAAFVGPVWNVVIGTFEILLTPDRLRSRVMSAELVLAFGAIPLGSLAAGLLLSAVSPKAAALVLAGVMLALAVAATADPAIRHAPELPSDPDALPQPVGGETG